MQPVPVFHSETCMQATALCNPAVHQQTAANLSPAGKAQQEAYTEIGCRSAAVLQPTLQPLSSNLTMPESDTQSQAATVGRKETAELPSQTHTVLQVPAVVVTAAIAPGVCMPVLLLGVPVSPTSANILPSSPTVNPQQQAPLGAAAITAQEGGEDERAESAAERSLVQGSAAALEAIQLCNAAQQQTEHTDFLAQQQQQACDVTDVIDPQQQHQQWQYPQAQEYISDQGLPQRHELQQQCGAALKPSQQHSQQHSQASVARDPANNCHITAAAGEVATGSTATQALGPSNLSVLAAVSKVSNSPMPVSPTPPAAAVTAPQADLMKLSKSFKPRKSPQKPKPAAAAEIAATLRAAEMTESPVGKRQQQQPAYLQEYVLDMQGQLNNSSSKGNRGSGSSSSHGRWHAADSIASKHRRSGGTTDAVAAVRRKARKPKKRAAWHSLRWGYKASQQQRQQHVGQRQEQFLNRTSAAAAISGAFAAESLGHDKNSSSKIINHQQQQQQQEQLLGTSSAAAAIACAFAADSLDHDNDGSSKIINHQQQQQQQQQQEQLLDTTSAAAALEYAFAAGSLCHDSSSSKIFNQQQQAAAAPSPQALGAEAITGAQGPATAAVSIAQAEDASPSSIVQANPQQPAAAAVAATSTAARCLGAGVRHEAQGSTLEAAAAAAEAKDDSAPSAATDAAGGNRRQLESDSPHLRHRPPVPRFNDAAAADSGGNGQANSKTSRPRVLRRQQQQQQPLSARFAAELLQLQDKHRQAFRQQRQQQYRNSWPLQSVADLTSPMAGPAAAAAAELGNTAVDQKQQQQQQQQQQQATVETQEEGPADVATVLQSNRHAVRATESQFAKCFRLLQQQQQHQQQHNKAPLCSWQGCAAVPVAVQWEAVLGDRHGPPTRAVEAAALAPSSAAAAAPAPAAAAATTATGEVEQTARRLPESPSSPLRHTAVAPAVVPQSHGRPAEAEAATEAAACTEAHHTAVQPAAAAAAEPQPGCPAAYAQAEPQQQSNTAEAAAAVSADANDTCEEFQLYVAAPRDTSCNTAAAAGGGGGVRGDGFAHTAAAVTANMNGVPSLSATCDLAQAAAGGTHEVQDDITIDLQQAAAATGGTREVHSDTTVDLQQEAAAAAGGMCKVQVDTTVNLQQEAAAAAAAAEGCAPRYCEEGAANNPQQAAVAGEHPEGHTVDVQKPAIDHVPCMCQEKVVVDVQQAPAAAPAAAAVAGDDLEQSHDQMAVRQGASGDATQGGQKEGTVAQHQKPATAATTTAAAAAAGDMTQVTRRDTINRQHAVTGVEAAGCQQQETVSLQPTAAAGAAADEVSEGPGDTVCLQQAQGIAADVAAEEEATVELNEAAAAAQEVDAAMMDESPEVTSSAEHTVPTESSAPPAAAAHEAAAVAAREAAAGDAAAAIKAAAAAAAARRDAKLPEVKRRRGRPLSAASALKRPKLAQSPLPAAAAAGNAHVAASGVKHKCPQQRSAVGDVQSTASNGNTGAVGHATAQDLKSMGTPFVADITARKVHGPYGVRQETAREVSGVSTSSKPWQLAKQSGEYSATAKFKVLEQISPWGDALVAGSMAAFRAEILTPSARSLTGAVGLADGRLYLSGQDVLLPAELADFPWDCHGVHFDVYRRVPKMRQLKGDLLEKK